MKLRKILSAVVASAIVATGLAGCDDSSSSSGSSSGSSNSGGSSSGSKETLTVWAPEEVVSLTQTMLDEWLATTDYADKYTITVSAQGEGEAATQLLTDVEAGADVFAFAQDQLARLTSVGALSPLGGTFLTTVQETNDEACVSAASLDGTVYAYPETSDNTYFLFYDKSVVTDPSTLEGILDSCAAAGKYLYFDLESGWYDVSYFFGTGGECYYNYDSDGNVTGAVCNYNSDAGLAAMKAMVATASHSGFMQSTGSDAAFFNPDGGNAGAIISGTWNTSTVKEYLGDNFGVAALPTFTVDGTTYQMGGFGGYKLVGVKPQTDSDKLVFAHLVAQYITGEEMSLARFENNGWGPANLAAQASDEVQADEVISTVAEQMSHCVAQGQYPQAYWDLTKAFGTDIVSGMYKNADDATLLAALAELEAGIKAAT